MSTVVARFEPCKKDISRGAVYYRIYKGHNRRMEFSSRIRLLASSWDETTRTVKGSDPGACHLRTQIEADLKLLNQIITEDVAGLLTMGDMINIFKHRRTIVSPYSLP
ncbi:Arm DNA-binding domain-containing protein [Bacteroides uniformis]|uniref:Arm DNA-binding domain-containing protein n=1 Tax=Bacteroides uniformis TaxID=820 RepID=UPI003565424A